MNFKFKLALSLIGAAISSLFAAPGIVWHEPANPHPDLGGPTMRAPLYEVAGNDITVYQGFFKNFGANGNQTGGNVFYRVTPRGGVIGAWTSVPLGFFSNVGGTQFWSASIPTSTFAASDVIEYYIEVTFDGTEPETTYLFGGDLLNNFTAGTDQAAAQAAPYSIRNRPGWILHGGNITAADNNLNLQLKTGYIGPDNSPASRWANNGAVYYTTDGTDPAGSLGTASNASTSAAPLVFDGTQRDDSGNGNAALWIASLPNVLDGLAFGSQVKYRIGLWNDATNEEKFADHSAGQDNQIFVYQNGQLGQPNLTINGLNANYTTSKLFIDEIANDSIPLDIVFAPGEANLTEVEVYTNLNRRDRADEDANNDGYDDGISGIDPNLLIAGDDAHYFKAYTMTNEGAGTYTLTLPAQKTGAYRLTARWKVAGDPNWRWYTNAAANRRDHAITVSPVDARNINLYEINVLNIEATDDTFANRSTIEDMHNAFGALHNLNNRWDLDYLKALGANWLWFQPIHPTARDGREPFGGWDQNNPPYEPGSPYAVRNFFEVNPVMSRNFQGDPFSDAALLDQANRDAAMTAWQNFMVDADAKGVGIMLDSPFNHTGFDVELGQPGVDLLQPSGATWDQHDQIRDREARFFSADGNYGQRASSAANIAAGPDRFDFGKWRDVKDVYFGRYDALVETDTSPERSSYTNESDLFFFDDANWNSADFTQNGQDRNVTRQVWKYFATYATHWLDKTRPAGQNRNSETEPNLTLEQRYEWDARGIDGLRCDFGQGLPPRCWEYIINVAREKKWNFVMMSESLDGGAVTYRSNRHFDILNENIVFPLKSATTAADYRNIFEGRRNAYGQGLVLINNVSHDEENYTDPWEALIRYSVACTMDGVPMIFPGQELGISYTFGYDHYETNFGKQIPHFKRYNSMQPIWNDTNFGNDQLYPVYSGMGSARLFSPSLRSSNRWFLDGDGNNSRIHAVAKYQTEGAAPATTDVTLNFVNLDRNAQQSDNYKVPTPLADRIGLASGRIYNSKNIAAYTAQQSNRRDLWLWGNGFTRDQLINDGFFVQLYPVPASNSGWLAEPYEAQFLKVYDITAPTATAPAAAGINDFAYAIEGSVFFDWEDMAPDSAGVRPAYEVTIDIDGTTSTTVTTVSQILVDALPGQQVNISLQAVNPDFTANKGPLGSASQSIKVLSPTGDEDQDGQTNAEEDLAGANPLDNTSLFAPKSITRSGNGVILQVQAKEGRFYHLQASDTMDDGDWETVQSNQQGSGTEISLSHTTDPGLVKNFYRIMVTGAPIE
mgnify:CR=1 FL=1